MHVEDWSASLGKIEAIARQVLQHGRAWTVLDGDEAAAGIASYTSGMGPLLGHWLEQGKIACSVPIAAVLELHLRHNRLRMQRMADRMHIVSEELSKRGVPHVVLKGMDTAFRYFPEPGARPLADIDLLIGLTDKRHGCEALRACGFHPGLERAWPAEQGWRHVDAPAEPRSLGLVHADDPWTIDLHTSLNRRYAAGSPVIRLDNVLGTSLLGQLGPHPLPQPALLLQLAVHASCGLINLTLIRLAELALVVRKDVAEGLLSWSSFVAAAEQAGAIGSVYPSLKLCEDLAPGTVPVDLLHRLRQDTPRAVQRAIDPLSPASAHMVVRCSIAERFMWAPSRWAALRQVLDEALPPGSASVSTLLSIYRTRIMRLARHTLTQ